MQLERFEPFRIASLKKRMAMLAPKVQSLTSSASATPAPKPVEVLPSPVISSVDSAATVVSTTSVVGANTEVETSVSSAKIPTPVCTSVTVTRPFEAQITARRGIPNKRLSNTTPILTEMKEGT
jgi:hypothetical protein